MGALRKYGEVLWTGMDEEKTLKQGNKFLTFITALWMWGFSPFAALKHKMFPGSSPKPTFHPFPVLSVGLRLSSLSRRGQDQLMHDGSFVHLDGVESYAPDPKMVKELYDFSNSYERTGGEVRKYKGLTFTDLTTFHAERIRGKNLNEFHRRTAKGECAILWLEMRSGKEATESEPEIAPSTIQRFFGEERLPDHWFDKPDAAIQPIEEGERVCYRPSKTIGVLETLKLRNLIKTEEDKIING